jgi:hypothetical protein
VTGRGADLDTRPIAAMVSVYHSGKSEDQPPTAAVTVDEHEPEAGPSTLQKIGSIFAASTRKHEDFPRGAPYEGVLSELQRRPEQRSEPLEPTVSVYHHGQSDVVELQRPTTSAVPAPTPAYDGPVDELPRRTEMGALPLDSRVTVYPPPPPPEEVELLVDGTTAERPPKESSSSTLTRRITSIFKRPTAHDDFPTSDPYSGEQAALGTTSNELPAEPLQARVSAYHHSGRSDEETPAATTVEEKPAADPLARITSMFGAKSAPADGYPETGPAYDGPVQQLARRSETDGVALDSLVLAYHHSGRSDERPAKRAPMEEEAEEPQKAPSTLKKLTGVFTRHPDFPHSEPFQGQPSEMGPGAELRDERIDSRVALYHTTGRSDQQQQQPVEAAPVPVQPLEPKKQHETLGRLASLFATRKARTIR